MRSHWVLLICILTMLPVCFLALGLGVIVALTMERLSNTRFNHWTFWSIVVVVFGLFLYGSLRLIKPDKLIAKLLRR